MSERGDRKHFAEYTPQNQAKHSILNEYYPAYLTALKKQADRFHFIDAFAGPGQYAGGHDGSPLLALAAMEKAGVLSRSTISCVENQADFANALEETLRASPLPPAGRARGLAGGRRGAGPAGKEGGVPVSPPRPRRRRPEDEAGSTRRPTDP